MVLQRNEFCNVSGTERDVPAHRASELDMSTFPTRSTWPQFLPRSEPGQIELEGLYPPLFSGFQVGLANSKRSGEETVVRGLIPWLDPVCSQWMSLCRDRDLIGSHFYTAIYCLWSCKHAFLLLFRQRYRPLPTTPTYPCILTMPAICVVFL